MPLIRFTKRIKYLYILITGLSDYIALQLQIRPVPSFIKPTVTLTLTNLISPWLI